MSGSAAIRDQLYQEGIALGDYVINEFVRSGEVASIFNNDVGLMELFESRLKDEVIRFRASAIQMMQDVEFIDASPVKAENDTDILRPAYSVPSPAAVSRPVIDLLKSMDLAGTPPSKQPRTLIIDRADIFDEGNPHGLTEKSPDADQELNSDDVSALSGIFPLFVSEIKIFSRSLFESKDPFRLFGILESSEARVFETPRRKRRKELLNGYFDKDGNYQALIYAGYVHLCSGALEWPFKIAEIRFNDFYEV